MSRTRRQEYPEVLAFIIQFKHEHDGVAPSLREICDQCNLASTSTAVYALQSLQRLGKIVFYPGAPRFIRVVGARWLPPAQG